MSDDTTMSNNNIMGSSDTPLAHPHHMTHETSHGRQYNLHSLTINGGDGQDAGGGITPEEGGGSSTSHILTFQEMVRMFQGLHRNIKDIFDGTDKLFDLLANQARIEDTLATQATTEDTDMFTSCLSDKEWEAYCFDAYAIKKELKDCKRALKSTSILTATLESITYDDIFDDAGIILEQGGLDYRNDRQCIKAKGSNGTDELSEATLIDCDSIGTMKLHDIKGWLKEKQIDHTLNQHDLLYTPPTSTQLSYSCRLSGVMKLHDMKGWIKRFSSGYNCDVDALMYLHDIKVWLKHSFTRLSWKVVSSNTFLFY